MAMIRYFLLQIFVLRLAQSRLTDDLNLKLYRAQDDFIAAKTIDRQQSFYWLYFGL